MVEKDNTIKKSRILVIDDDIDLAYSLKELIELGDVYVDVAFNGKEGISKHTYSPYDLIITDIIMPVMDGLEVVMWFKRNSPKTKLIVVSGGGYFESKDYLKMAKELGADCVLQKPFTFKDIIDLIEIVLIS